MCDCLRDFLTKPKNFLCTAAPQSERCDVSGPDFKIPSWTFTRALVGWVVGFSVPETKIQLQRAPARGRCGNAGQQGWPPLIDGALNLVSSTEVVEGSPWTSFSS